MVHKHTRSRHARSLSSSSAGAGTNVGVDTGTGTGTNASGSNASADTSAGSNLASTLLTDPSSNVQGQESVAGLGLGSGSSSSARHQQQQQQQQQQKQKQKQETRSGKFIEQSSNSPNKEFENLSASQQESLQLLLGSSLTSWPFSESSLIRALELKAEQERTKQEYYKVESLSRSIELLKNCLDADIPKSLIPLVFSGQNMTNETIQSIVQQNEYQLQLQAQAAQQQRMSSPLRRAAQPTSSQQAAQAAQQQQAQFQQTAPISIHERSQTISSPRELYQHPAHQQISAGRGMGGPSSGNAPVTSLSTAPFTPIPIGYRFGGETPSSSVASAKQNPPLSQPAPVSPISYARQQQLQQQQQQQQRQALQMRQQQLSPAKMGAHAVSSLSGHYRSYGAIGRHERTTSLPPQVSIPESSAVQFYENPQYQQPFLQQQQQQQQQQQAQQAQSQQHQASRSPSRQQQQTKQPVILQHQIIQFHHWTPEESNINTAEGTSSSGNATTSKEVSSPSKRRRSNPDDDSFSTPTKEVTRNIILRKKHVRTRSDTSAATTATAPADTATTTTSTAPEAESKSESEKKQEANEDEEISSTKASSGSTAPTKETGKSSRGNSQPRFPNNILSSNNS
ncbi:hypothetical protein PACTADRAFT_50494 [Pachysolen tannophilus NRRL Y-2460]|uniref:Uncharacterized protein n=1 Tax=Pachysolen tannophilus NRRL Y-2460 TaxID=669874 RepID=A0A1E4TSB0_PACTA|nr:hypothetical protein PACTADRAFT_50494 [Pachysolen tannophilus NRRL Y-2460]